jgi:hypothetical protein
VFDIGGAPGSLERMGMTLEQCEVLAGGFVWLLYRFTWGA